MQTLKIDYAGTPIEVDTEHYLIKGVRFVKDANSHYKNEEFEKLVKGEKSIFTIDFNVIKPDIKDILFEVAKIPFGFVSTYGDISLKVFKTKRYSRFVGFALAKNPLPIVIPCHRVVGFDLTLHGFTGGLYLKEKLLTAEGVQLKNGKVEKRFLISF
ncbi:MAG: MGMT family protein [Caldisericaceae bacterium]